MSELALKIPDATPPLFILTATSTVVDDAVAVGLNGKAGHATRKLNQ
jgi:hypothetical protein